LASGRAFRQNCFNAAENSHFIWDDVATFEQKNVGHFLESSWFSVVPVKFVDGGVDSAAYGPGLEEWVHQFPDRTSCEVTKPYFWSLMLVLCSYIFDLLVHTGFCCIIWFSRCDGK